MTTDINAPSARTALESAVRGLVLWPGDPRVERELAGFNTAARHRPAVVVTAADADDVAAAVRYARSAGLSVGVHATGHGSTSSAGGVVVATGRMAGFSIDPARRTVTLQAGVTWEPVIAAAAAFGLAPLTGSSSAVGAVGYTVCGGAGLMLRRFGYAADHVHSLEVVTADGRVRRVDAEHDPDLFWAVRGGKSNFGIVTALTTALVPVARFYGGGIYYRGTHAAAVLHAYREWITGLGEDTTSSIALQRLPDLPAVPAPLRGTTTVHLRVAHLGPATEGARLLAPMRAAAPALIDRVRDMPFTEVDTIHNDPRAPRPSWGRGRFLRELPAAAVDALLAVAGPDRDLPLTNVEVRHLGGAASRRPDPPNAVNGRHAGLFVGVVGPVPPPLREVVPAAGQGVLDVVAPWTAPDIPIQFPHALRSPDEVDQAWSPSDYRRLREIKRRYDPDGRFATGNVVIPPPP